MPHQHEEWLLAFFAISQTLCLYDTYAIQGFSSWLAQIARNHKHALHMPYRQSGQASNLMAGADSCCHAHQHAILRSSLRSTAKDKQRPLPTPWAQLNGQHVQQGTSGQKGPWLSHAQLPQKRRNAASTHE